MSDLRIQQCRGCHNYWFKNPGHCVKDDDMAPVLGKMRNSDVFFLFGSPVHFRNVSGCLKTFFDRMTAAGGNPHHEKPEDTARSIPAYIMVANRGFPSRSQFDVISFLTLSLEKGVLDFFRWF